MSKILHLALFLTLPVSTVSGADFPPPYNSEPGAPPAAELALGKLRLPDGFKATLFAAEPQIQNPIAATWDRRGRLWVAENYTYAERQKRFDLNLNDRVIILEDINNDGVADGRKVFTDQVKMLTSVEVGRGGAWLMCPPQLLFVPDANGDDVPDSDPVVVLDGFDVAKDNYHNFANGLRWGPDGWLYGRCGNACPANIGVPGTPDHLRMPMTGGIWRFHPQSKTVEVLCEGTTNPWGHDWDETGEMFFSNTVIGHIWHLMPGAHFMKPSGSSRDPNVYEELDHIADHYHFDTNGTWQESRDGNAGDYGGGHSHIGGMVYQADQWPERFRGKYMMLNQHGRRINVERIEPQGAGFVAKHEPDAVFSDDPWFVGIDLTTGPDGSVFVLDWSDTGECHDLSGVHRESGRIYKISYGEPKAPELGLLDHPAIGEVLKALSHPNAWYYRQLRSVLRGESLQADLSDKLMEISNSPEQPVPHRLRALWLLHEHQLLDAQNHLAMITDPEPEIRAWGIRFMADRLPIDRMDGIRRPDATEPDSKLTDTLTQLLEKEKSALVRGVAASLTYRLPYNRRFEIARLLVRNAEDEKRMSMLLWPAIAGIGKSSPSQLCEIASISQWPTLTRYIARYVSAANDRAPLARLLESTLPPGMETPVLRGMIEGHAGLTTATKPASWEKFAARVGDESARSAIQKLSILFGDVSTISALTTTILEPQAPMAQRQTALDTLIDSRIPRLQELCMKVIATPVLNGNALRGLALSDDTATAERIIANYAHFLPASRPALMDIMVGRPEWAGKLLDAIAAGTIPRTDLGAHSARRIRDMKNAELTTKLDSVWGTFNVSPEHKSKEIAALKAKLTPAVLAEANLSNGRKWFAMSCGTCHTLYGEGGKIGPDLTGSGRANLGYLAENIIDPSAVVSADHRITTVTLKDGRNLAGVIAASTEKTLTLRLAAETQTLERGEITHQETTNVSMMPEGILNALDADQTRDIIAYLMHPNQVPLPEK